jgi:hypothetical protein
VVRGTLKATLGRCQRDGSQGKESSAVSMREPCEARSEASSASTGPWRESATHMTLSVAPLSPWQRSILVVDEDQLRSRPTCGEPARRA